MGEISISTGQDMLRTGKTVSEIQQDRMDKNSGASLEGGKSFADTLGDAMNSVNDMHKQADVAMQGIATGENKNIPEVLIAVEKADIAFKMMLQVRNKIIDAYQEVMKMQV